MSSSGNEPVILSAVRTPTGNFQGALSSLKATQLGALAVKAALERAGVPGDRIDEVIMGHVVQAGTGQAPARQAAIGAGLPDNTPSMAVNKVCGSGLKAVMIASSMIKAGDADVLIAGGQESMSNVPYGLMTARNGMRLGNQVATDLMIHDGLWCCFNDCHMGNLAEYTADKAELSREDLDQFAYGSHMKAANAQQTGKFDEEIVPVEVPQRKGDPVIVSSDETPKPDTTVEVLSKLRPAFQKDGKVTAGNAPGLNDGASALVVAARSVADELGTPILARITGYSQAAVAPKEIFFAPVEAVRKLVAQIGVDIHDFDLIEANEAFAAQYLGCEKELRLNREITNINGSGIGLGHPVGSTGSRIMVTLIHAMKKRGNTLGLATLCGGGGVSLACAIEML